jgi:hypothetical protein
MLMFLDLTFLGRFGHLSVYAKFDERAWEMKLEERPPAADEAEGATPGFSA